MYSAQLNLNLMKLNPLSEDQQCASPNDLQNLLSWLVAQGMAFLTITQPNGHLLCIQDGEEELSMTGFCFI